MIPPVRLICLRGQMAVKIINRKITIESRGSLLYTENMENYTIILRKNGCEVPFTAIFLIPVYLFAIFLL